MKITPFTDQYLEDSALLFVEEYSEESRIWIFDKAKEYLKRDIDNFPEYCFVATDDDNKYLGAIFCRVDPYYDSYLLFIDSLQIKKENRNQGIAKELLRTVLDVAKKNNIKGLHMLADGREGFPKKWYQKIGLKESGWVEYEALLEEIRI